MIPISPAEAHKPYSGGDPYMQKSLDVAFDVIERLERTGPISPQRATSLSQTASKPTYSTNNYTVLNVLMSD